MAGYYNKIGARVTDFFKKKDYNFGRTVSLKVNDENTVNWAVEAKLTDEGKLDSTLDVCHNFEKEKASLKTSTKDNPKFKLDTKRIPKVGTVITVQEPKLTIENKFQKPKFSVSVETSYDWTSHDCTGKVGVAVEPEERVAAGVQVDLKKEGQDGPIAVSDYAVAAQFRRNDKQLVTLTTEKQLNQILLGGAVQFKDDYTGVVQLGYSRSEGDLEWRLGLETQLNERDQVRLLYRKDGSGTVAFKGAIPDQNFKAEVAYNFDLSKPADSRHSLEYKLIFG